MTTHDFLFGVVCVLRIICGNCNNTEVNENTAVHQITQCCKQLFKQTLSLYLDVTLAWLVINQHISSVNINSKPLTKINIVNDNYMHDILKTNQI